MKSGAGAFEDLVDSDGDSLMDEDGGGSGNFGGEFGGEFDGPETERSGSGVNITLHGGVAEEARYSVPDKCAACPLGMLLHCCLCDHIIMLISRSLGFAHGVCDSCRPYSIDS